MNREDFLIDYWKYYIMLENDFINKINNIKLSEDNYSVYSDEYVKQLQTIGSEFDVICRQVCECNNSDHTNISNYADWIFKNVSDITLVKINIRYQRVLQIEPFKGWKRDKPGELFWWSAYNCVKHNRTNNFSQGNLKNVLNALGALYYMEMFLIKKIGSQTDEIDVPNSFSKLFEICGWQTRDTLMGDDVYAYRSEEIKAMFDEILKK